MADKQDNNMTHDLDAKSFSAGNSADIDSARPSFAAGMIDSFDDLPPADTKRWVVRRKEQVVQAVQAGRLTREAVCERYRLSDEEYQSWEDHLLRHGVRGLRVTRLQDYRRPVEAPPAATRLRERA